MTEKIPKIPLSGLQQGQKAVIFNMQVYNEHLHKLMVFGLLPGAEVEVLQHFPSVVVAIGNTYLALDREIAEEILVVLGG